MEQEIKKNNILIVILCILFILVIIGGIYIIFIKTSYDNNYDIDNKTDDVEDVNKNQENSYLVPKDIDKAVYNSNLNLNGKNVNIKFNYKTHYDDLANCNVYYSILLNDKVVWNYDVEAFNYWCGIDDDGELLDEKDYVIDNPIKYISKITDDNNNEYLVINFDLPEETGIYHKFIIINDSGKLFLDYNHWISSYFYKISGKNDKRYLLNSNNCNKYFSEDYACKDIKNIYSTYIIEDNKVYFLECNEGENNILHEHVASFSNNNFVLTDSKDNYKISNLDKLSGGGFSCPTYTKK